MTSMTVVAIDIRSVGRQDLFSWTVFFPSSDLASSSLSLGLSSGRGKYFDDILSAHNSDDDDNLWQN